MKNLLLAALCLLFALTLPLLCFAEGNEAPIDKNTFESVMNVIWYVILAVLFSGGLILVSKWSKKINQRDAELEQQLAEQRQNEEEAAESENETEVESSLPQQEDSEN